MSEEEKETPQPPTSGGGGCLASLAIFVLIGVLIFWLVSSCAGRSQTESDNTEKTYSEGALSVKCERAIEPDKAANYTVVDMGDNLYIVSGQTTSGLQYHCHFRGGFDNASLIEVNVGD